MQDDDPAFPHGYVNRPGNAVPALNPHLPKFVPERLDVGLANLMQSKFFDQMNDMIKLGPHIPGKVIKLPQDGLIKNLDAPWHDLLYQI